MKKITFIIVALLLNFAAMATVWDGTTATNFGSQLANAGESEANPIIITTPSQWMYAANLGPTDANRAKKFALGDNLDFNNLSGAKSFGPLTSGAVFDGKGYTISNIILNSTTVVQGLFTTVTSTTVKNLGLTGNGNIKGISNTAGIVSTATTSTISNCYNTTPVSGDIVSTPSANSKAFQIGGIVGLANNCTIQDCYNTGAITGAGRSAGIVGAAATTATTISRCYNKGAISGVFLNTTTGSNYGDCGGILGYCGIAGTTIESCYNSGNVNVVVGGTTGNSYVGGIVGSGIVTGASITNCFNTGNITLAESTNYPNAAAVGGIIGSAAVAITNCYNTGINTNSKVSNTGVGGIVGIATSKNLPVNCYTLTGDGYNDVDATTPRVKTVAELQAPGFVTTINNSQNPAKWKADYASPMNGGFPIFVYMTSTIPDPPSAIVATVGNTQTSIAFTAPVGYTVLDYTATAYNDGELVTSVTGTSSPLVLTGLSNSINYAYYVSARTSAGSSSPALATVPGLVAIKLVTPTLLTATNITAPGFTANWSTIPNAVGYRVSIYLNNNLLTTNTINGKTTTSYTYAANSLGYTYTYKVTALGDGVRYSDSDASTNSSPVKTIGNQVVLPRILNSNMVLQQDMQVALWGWGAPNDVISITSGWGEMATATVDTDGNWSTKIQTPKAIAGQAPAYTLTFAGANNTVALSNILIGDVWLCSGQSNMLVSLGASTNSATEVAVANYPTLRYISAGDDTAPGPNVQNNSVSGTWTVCSPSTASSFGAVAYYFGRELVSDHQINIPIGLIRSAVGGSRCESWVRNETLVADPFLKSTFVDPYIANPSSYPTNQLKPSWCYNGLIAPIINMSIKGALWYQGEGNAATYSSYKQLWGTLIQDWRSLCGVGDFPFYYVQLPNYTTSEPWAMMRETQTGLLTLKNVGMAVTLEVGDNTNIHPINKYPVGKRLSLWAKAKTYGQNIVYSGPVYKSSEVVNNTMVISFLPQTIGGGLISSDATALKGFQIAGADNVLYAANATISGNTVIVSSPNVAVPVKVWYAFTNAPEVNLTNSEGLPTCPFRTETWDANVGGVITKLDAIADKQGIFKVQGNTIIAPETGAIQLFDLQGKRLFAAKGVSVLKTNLKKGIYIACFTNEIGNTFSEKLILR